MGMGALQNVKIMKMVKSRDVGTPCVSPVRYVLIIQSNVESSQKMIQFNIQFKMNSKIFIQSKNSFKS